MLAARIEHERPAEWLRWLAESPDGYHQLLAQGGGLSRAAYRVASARCRAHGRPSGTPTLRELQAAAVMLVDVLGTPDSLPMTLPASLLVSDCEAQGLPVIGPLQRAS